MVSCISTLLTIDSDLCHRDIKIHPGHVICHLLNTLVKISLHFHCLKRPYRAALPEQPEWLLLNSSSSNQTDSSLASQPAAEHKVASLDSLQLRYTVAHSHLQALSLVQ